MKIHCRREFGYYVIGPILASMLDKLFSKLNNSNNLDRSTVFFCARGGLVLRRMLDLYANRFDLEPRFTSCDFMISRVAAARVALLTDPIAVAPLLALELKGRSCADAASAMTNIRIEDEKWRIPFSIDDFFDLVRNTSTGQYVEYIMSEQSSLLKHHVDALRTGKQHVILCDTGVFGSIGRYLEVGVPYIQWNSVLLYRSNYKGIGTPHFGTTSAAISEADCYLPWCSQTVALLYWPFIEDIFEPHLPSVTLYKSTSHSVTSNLEGRDWQSGLIACPGSIREGADTYIKELTIRSKPANDREAKAAWRTLQNMIVFPTHKDINLLSLGRRELNFGTSEYVDFSSVASDPRQPFSHALKIVKSSIWPEGELRKQFPRGAIALQLWSELSRYVKALRYTLLVQAERLGLTD